MYKIISCTLVVIFHVSVTVGKYFRYDPNTYTLLQCDQCPPGTFVKQDCTAGQRTECAPCPPNHYSDQWNFDKECQFCSTVCKELQHVKQECNSTRNRQCECSAGHFLDVEFCLPHSGCPPGFGVLQRGTPESDTVCGECPKGMFSNVTSATAPCQKQINCMNLGLKVAHKGSSTEDTLCEEESRFCETDIGLCEEALFRFPKAAANWSDVLIPKLHPTVLTLQQIESIKQSYEPTDWPFYLFKLYKSQSKGDNSVRNLVQDINDCEKEILKQIGHLPLTTKHLISLMQSLPGKAVKKKDIENILKSCVRPKQILKILSLWRDKNGGNTIEGLKQLTTNRLPKTLRKAMKRLERFLSGVSVYRLYEKIILQINGAQSQLGKSDSLL
ncbi:PREDICTED: tumor necrosis factor receptor superfamily member 11B [Nanorana parkeri]|uniref:tumor necrosis factor receptor superfamily member 11B n=1 Tax=Nanorana parkeri TaxID=125878 RepID=UPI000854D17A|nr:PREDICTED: tumor necrosis factor receptor superfamily member 11B [Nanorana parkeri]